MRKVVVSDSGVTLGSLKDMIRQLEDGSLTGKQLDDFVAHRDPFRPPSTSNKESSLPLRWGDEISFDGSTHNGWTLNIMRQDKPGEAHHYVESRPLHFPHSPYEATFLSRPPN